MLSPRSPSCSILLLILATPVLQLIQYPNAPHLLPARRFPRAPVSRTPFPYSLIQHNRTVSPPVFQPPSRSSPLPPKPADAALFRSSSLLLARFVCLCCTLESFSPVFGRALAFLSELWQPRDHSIPGSPQWTRDLTRRILMQCRERRARRSRKSQLKSGFVLPSPRVFPGLATYARFAFPHPSLSIVRLSLLHPSPPSRPRLSVFSGSVPREDELPADLC